MHRKLDVSEMIFSDKIDDKATGKNLASLEKSRKIRSDFILKYGFVPESILKHNKNSCSITNKQKRNYSRFSISKNKNLFRISGQCTRAGALSSFFQVIGRLMVDFYCPENGIVYDPFAGHNSRMELTFKTNRHYIGVDISKSFMIENRKIKEELINEQGFFKSDKTITLIECSSKNVDLPNNHADFTITSPPYWNLEYYGDEPEQLGNAKTYNKFLKLITEHIQENLRILKPGAFCAWFVNDFVKDKTFYPYHIDLFNIFVEVGFEPFQIYIVDLGASISQAFVQQIISSKRFPKRHEYCLLFRKR